MDLQLDSDEDHPRRLVVFPSCKNATSRSTQRQQEQEQPPMLAFGGDDGSLTYCDPNQIPISIRTLCQYDDAALRAVAVSSDGKRVAVGFDNGSTRLYNYDDYDINDNNNTNNHPFVPLQKKSKSDNDGDSDNEDSPPNDNTNTGGGFLSQPDRDDDDYEDEREGRCWAGPQVDGPVRDLKFLPNSHWLAIASESGLFVVHAQSSDTIADRYLETQASKEHDGCGIRGISITAQDDKYCWMASLAMDGRLCVWNVMGLDQKQVTDTVPVFRDSSRCVSRKDIGESNDATPSDRSCLPLWVDTPEDMSEFKILALPGKAQLQLRAVSTNTKDDTSTEVVVQESEKPVAADPSRGHIESVVALTNTGNFVVSSGNDGRVILWKVEQDEAGLPTAEFVELLGQYKSIPTSLYWNVTNNVLYMACANGTLEMVQDMHKKLKAKNNSHKAKQTAKQQQSAQKEAAAKDTAETQELPSPVKKTVEEQQKSHRRVSIAGSVDDEDEDTEEKESPGKTTDEESKKKSQQAQEDLLVDSDSDDSDNEDQSDKENAKKPTEKSDTSSPKKPLTQVSPEKDDDMDSIMDDGDGLETQPPPSAIREALKKLDEDDDDDDLLSDKPSKKPVETKKTSSTATMDEDSDDEDALESSKSKTKESKIVNWDSDSDNDEDAVEEEPKTQANKSKTSKTTKRLSKQSKTDDDDDDDDEDDAIFDEESPVKSTQNSAPKNSFIEDEAEDAQDDDADGEDDEVMVDESATQEAKSNNDVTATQDDKDDAPAQGSGDATQNHNDDDDDNDNGFDNYNDDDEDENSLQNDIDELKDRLKNRDYSGGGYGGPVLPEPQAAFAPSSTPLDLTRRFMCWNNVGSITLMRDELGTRSSVDVSFTDAAFRRPISFTDNMGFILGSLGDDGAIFATDLAQDEDDDLEEDDELAGLSLSEQTKAALKKSQKLRMRKGSAGKRPTGSSIYFHRFETFGSLREKDWYLTLPDGERIMGVAAGQQWAAVATSRKFLRLFTSGGAQGQILWLPGTPVTMTGRDRFLAVIYHESMPLQDGTQKLGYMLYDAVGNKTIAKGSVSCISAGSSLSWVGFSNDCSLMTMDSDGMLSMLVATSAEGLGDDDTQGLTEPVSWEWSPLLDTVGLRKSTDDSFWPVTVYNGKLVCVPLKGGTEYPDASRRPVTTTLAFRMPLARSTLGKSSALEELSVRSNVALVQKKVNNQISSGELMGDGFEDEYRTLCAQVDKVSLKLFAATVEAGKLERALDLVDRLHLEKSYELAMTLAESHDKLVDFIEEAKERKFAAVDDEEEQGDDDAEDNEVDYEESRNTSFDEPVGTSPEHRTQAMRRISPDASNSLKAKRSFGQHQPGALQRNVRAKAF